MSPQPNFVERNPFDLTGGGFSCTNEEPETFRAMLESSQTTFAKGAGIVSGGEVFLFSLLPFCDTLIGVDHSTRSLATCWIKMYLIDTLGPRGAKTFFTSYSPTDVTETSAHYRKFLDKVQEVSEKVPVELKPKLTLKPSTAFDKNIQPQSVDAIPYSGDLSYIRREWLLVPDETLEVVVKKLDKVTLIHGDLVEDLKDHATFDLLYISNALEHSGRSGKPKVDHFDPLVKENGLVVISSHTKMWVDTKRWGLLKFEPSKRSGWTHSLLRKTAAVEDALAKGIAS